GVQLPRPSHTKACCNSVEPSGCTVSTAAAAAPVPVPSPENNPGATFAIVACPLSTSPEALLTITVTWPNGTSAGTTALICPGDTNFKPAIRSTPMGSRKITDTPPSVVGNGMNTALARVATKLSPKIEANESGDTGALKLAALTTTSCRGIIVSVNGDEVAAPN